jgi:hypothetical protein
LPGSALKVPGGVGSYPLLSKAPIAVEVELVCNNNDCGTAPGNLVETKYQAQTLSNKHDPFNIHAKY